MTLLDNIRAAVDPLSDDYVAHLSWVVMRQDQYDALKADVDRPDSWTPSIYRPDGTIAKRGAMLGIDAYLSTPVVVRTVGASTADLSGTILDLRST